IDLADDADLVRRIEADAHLDMMRRDVGNPAVQCQWCVTILAGRPVGGQAAAAQPLVKAANPAEPAAVARIDMAGMHGADDGRLPAERLAEVVAAPQP